MTSWIVKYSPKNLKEIFGQEKLVIELQNFVKQFPRVKKKALLIYGLAGTGKTSAVHALANELNFELVELNASDFRDKESVKSVLGAASQQASLFGQNKIILIDEVDGVAGREDRGGVLAITDVIKDTNFPIILTANDPYSQKLRTLRKNCTLLELNKVSQKIIVKCLDQICKAEKIECTISVIEKIASSSDGDIRGAINDLQLIAAQKNKINEEDVKLWSREREEKIFTLLKLIFKSYDVQSAMESFDNLNEDLDMLLLWLDQNIPAEYTKAIERRTAYKSLSDADIFLSRIMRWQHWRFLVYAQALAIAGVQLAKKSTNPNFVMHQRPELLLSLYIRAAKRKKIKGLGAQVASILHASSTRLAKSFWPYFVYIQEHNENQAAELSEYLGL